MKVITVRKSQRLLEIIKEIASDEEPCMIYIDNALVEKNELVQQRAEVNYVYEYKLDEYKLIFDVGDNATGNWYVLWDIIKPKEKNIYSFPCAYIMDCLYENSECKKVFLRKWGSKTKIGEE